MVAENIAEVMQNLARAAQQAGKKPGEIKLVAVSKTVDTEKIYQALQAGQMDFGENYAQEFKTKAQQIKDKINWHFIGQLQSNKVKYIIRNVALIHSVDRLSLAQEINKRAKGIDRKVDILLQVYLDEQKGRGGTGAGAVRSLLAGCAELENINICGLMSVAPLGQQAYENEKYFENVFKLFESLKPECPDNASMKILSMGMSGDYREAIKHGSNMVRIGTAIFGGR